MNQSCNVLPYAELKNKEISILEIARSIVLFYQKLTYLNKAFDHVFIVSERKRLYNSIDIKSANAVDQLADEILLQNKEDIVKIDQTDNPSVHYVRLGNFIHFSLGVEIVDELLLTLSFSFVQSEYAKTKIGTLGINQKCFRDLDDCVFFVQTLNCSFETEYVSMKLNFFDRDINKEVRKYKAPLGLVTYFSKSKYADIPLNLPGITYSIKDDGMFLVLNNANIFEKDVEIKLYVLELMKLMKQIEIDYPAYLKASNQAIP